MKDKPTWLTYFNNTVAFLILSLLRSFFKPNADGNSVLFINTGQIGDLIISSVIFNNINLLKEKYEGVFLLVKKEYYTLVESYNGLNVVKWDYKKYKYNFIYRIKFIVNLRNLKFKDCYNLTAARGITVDELSILSGAKNIYALNSNYKYLKRLFGKKTDKIYSNILAKDFKNEFDKNIIALKHINIKNFKTETSLKISEEVNLKMYALLKKFENKIKVVISPFTELNIKNWGNDRYNSLIINVLNTFKNSVILLIGTQKKKKEIEQYSFIDRNRVYNLSGQFNIIESASIVNCSDIFIGNDSGFTHIAKALQKPLIGIIGGGSHGYFFPYSTKKNEKYLYNKMDCFGCEWRCIHEKPYCLTGVSVDEVMKNISELLIN